MKYDSEYILSWSFLGTTRIRSKMGMHLFGVKKRYLLVCYVISCLGWIPSVLFSFVCKISSRPLHALLSIVCYCAFFYAVQYGFHVFLHTMNRKGKLSKYIEEK